MPKFFAPADQIEEHRLRICGEDAVHISRVLRMSVGDRMIVGDGRGTDYDVRIASIGANAVHADILSQSPSEAEPIVQVTLFQALPKQGKMEVIIQKSTELGVSKIVPVETKRCVVKPSNKLERWNKVALEAAKQCGRGVVPKVTQTISFAQAVAEMSSFAHRFMPYEGERERTLRTVLADRMTEVAFMVGPEGGFDDAEVELARTAGIETVTLGKRILRTETVAAALLPVILYQQGEW